MNQAITQMDEGTQQNAALVEEASASAESMRQQAAALVDAVAAFRLAQGNGARKPAGSKLVATRNSADDKISSFEDMIERHVQWKLRLKMILQGKGEDLDAAEAADDSACKLGEWLHGQGQQVQHLPEFQHLLEHHKRFHAMAGKVIQEHQRGRSAQAQALLEGDFTRETQATVTAIRAMRDAVEGKRRPAAAPARRAAAAPVAATPIKRSASSTAGDQHWQEF